MAKITYIITKKLPNKTVLWRSYLDVHGRLNLPAFMRGSTSAPHFTYNPRISKSAPFKTKWRFTRKPPPLRMFGGVRPKEWLRYHYITR